jgi:hypothetical protein
MGGRILSIAKPPDSCFKLAFKIHGRHVGISSMDLPNPSYNSATSLSIKLGF